MSTLELHNEPEQPVRLSPEQEACLHIQTTWLRYSCLFTCDECGALLILPEQAEVLGLCVCND